MRVDIASTEWIGAPHAPRVWQAEALPIALQAIAERKEGIIRAVMGAGKSQLMAEVVSSVYPDRDAIIVVTAPTVRLVSQLHATIAKRAKGLSRAGAKNVGRWYGKEKTMRPITIACHNSLGTLTAELRKQGKQVALWIADEAHRTNDTFCTQFYKDNEPAGIGFSATPYLSDEDSSLVLFTNELYSYGWKDALKDKVIVPWKIVHSTQGASTVDDAVLQMLMEYRQHHPFAPGICNASSIADANMFAQRLTNNGITAMPVHSEVHDLEIAERIDLLRRREISALVHVNMFVEGVDIPEVRWMALRRPVSSRVRFAQEVGRGLRADENKDVCTFFDPLDNFAALSLSYSAALSNGIDPDSVDRRKTLSSKEYNKINAALEHGEVYTQEQLAELMRIANRRSKVLGPVSSFLRRITLACEVLYPGMIDTSIKSKRWRRDAPSPAQLKLLKSLSVSYFDDTITGMPQHQLELIRFAATNGKVMTKGVVSDLIGITKALQRKGFSEQMKQLVE